VDPGFVWPEAYTNSEDPLKNTHKITNTKLGTKVNIYLGPLPGPWKGSMQVRGPDA